MRPDKAFFAFAITASFVWFPVALVQSHRLQPPGESLKAQQYTWVIHLWCLFGLCILSVIRPFWAEDMQPLIWDSSFGCHIFARILGTLPHVLFLNSLFFWLLKTKFFISFQQSPNNREYQILKCSVYGVSVTTLFSLYISQNTGPYIDTKGRKVCFQVQGFGESIRLVCIFLSFILYIWMTLIVKRPYEGLERLIEAIPGMRRYVSVNQWLSIATWVSTMAIYVISTLVVQMTGRSWSFALFGLPLFGFLIDNMIMFYTMYGSPFSLSRNILTVAAVGPTPTLRSEVEPFLYEFISAEEQNIVTIIIDYTFFDEDTPIWLEYEEYGVFRVEADVVERNTFLLDQLIDDEDYAESLEIDFQYRNHNDVQEMQPLPDAASFFRAIQVHE